MPIVREFVYSEWVETGILGLRPAWFHNANPTDGRGCAHDMLEHFRTQTSPLEGECEAMGSLLLLRLENGWAARHQPYAEDSAFQLSANIQQMMEDALRYDLDLPRPVRTRKLDEESADAAIVDAVNHAFCKLDDVCYDAGCTEEEGVRLQNPEVKAGFISWIRRGYRRAKKRFAGSDTYFVGMTVFDRITTKVNALLKAESLWEGAKVRISVHLRNRCPVLIRVFDPDSGRWRESDCFA